VALLVKDYPDHEAPIRAFHERWHETVAGVFEENVALLGHLQEAGVPTYCITNFSGAKFIEAKERFPFLASFDGVVVSGDERLLKPDPEIYHLLLRRYDLNAPDCIFIDDSKANVDAARDVGMQAIQYAEPMDLAAELRRYGFPV
jgi:2-haloacid dehalogenase